MRLRSHCTGRVGSTDLVRREGEYRGFCEKTRVIEAPEDATNLARVVWKLLANLQRGIFKRSGMKRTGLLLHYLSVDDKDENHGS